MVIHGLDVYGVVIDVEKAKREQALAQFGEHAVFGSEEKFGKESLATKLGIRMPPGVKLYEVTDRGNLSDAEVGAAQDFLRRYDAFHLSLYHNPDVAPHLPAVDGALEHIARLGDDGGCVVFISALRLAKPVYVKEWLEEHGLGRYGCEVIDRQRGATKVEPCKRHGVETYTDDDLEVLEPIEHDGTVSRLFLFSVDKKESIPEGSRIIQVGNWPNLLAKLTEITGR